MEAIFKGGFPMIKAVMLRWFLLLSGVVQIAYWSLSHLFFPKWYLASVGMTGLAENPGPVLIFMHEIGILTLGIGLVTMLSARDPVRNFSVIVMLYAVSVGSVATSLYHILVNHTASGEWATVVIIAVQLVILTALYPWSKLRAQP
jgi:hypothetical protein